MMVDPDHRSFRELIVKFFRIVVSCAHTMSFYACVDYIVELIFHRRRRRCLLCGFLIFAVAVGFLVFRMNASLGSLSSEFKSFKAGHLHDEGILTKTKILQVVHLDLKGAPPKMRYLIDLVPRLASAGVTGLLIEYEDMFPYESWIRNISSMSPYSKSEIEGFLRYCAEQDIEVIPLVQTFGHMEQALKLQEFRHLREDLLDPRAICPSDQRSLNLIEEMISQVLALHKFSKRIHIGCDEIYTLNVCPRCTMKHKSMSETFFSHVREIAGYIQETYNGTITPLIWDDMLRWKSYHLVKASNLQHYVEIVVWDYTATLEEQIRNQIWDKYSSIFKRIWVAGAFKGADGSRAMLPSMTKRYKNHKSWLQFVQMKASSTTIVGFISTGWSRYDHFAPLCELLPASIPSLMLNSLKLSTSLSSSRLSRDHINEYNNILRCRPGHRILPQFPVQDIYNLSHAHYCSFPESRLIFGTWQLEELQGKVDQLYDELYTKYTWGSEYQFEKNLLNSKQVTTDFVAKSFNFTNTWFFEIYAVLNQQMRLFYSENTIREWFETHVEPYSKKLRVLKHVLDRATQTNVWPRRDP